MLCWKRAVAAEDAEVSPKLAEELQPEVRATRDRPTTKQVSHPSLKRPPRACGNNSDGDFAFHT